MGQHGGDMKNGVELVRRKDRSHGLFIADVCMNAGEGLMLRCVGHEVDANHFCAVGEQLVLKNATKETRSACHQILRHFRFRSEPFETPTKSRRNASPGSASILSMLGEIAGWD